MGLCIVFNKKVVNSIKQYFDKEKKEKLMAILLKNENNIVKFVETIEFDENNYIKQSKNSVSLYPKYIKGIINYVISNMYDGFILVHNHNTYFPIFSPDDRKAHKKLLSYIRKNNLNIEYGTMIYANGRITLKISTKTRGLKFCRNLDKVNIENEI